MPRLARLTLLGLLAALVLLGTSCAGSKGTGAPVSARADARAASGASGGAATAPGPSITVDGRELLRDGVPWLARGVQVVGLVAPDSSLAGKYVAAHAHFGAAEIARALADHADLVRIQVSQYGLDPSSSLYSPAYVAEVREGVELARGDGLAVIVSLQAEPPAGEPTRCPLPNAGAKRVWSELAGTFGGDRGVLFELYNEPGLPPTPSHWHTWLDGGPVASRAGHCQAVGMQNLIDEIRGDGADNVIIVPGLEDEGTLAGMPRPRDPTDPTDPQLAYGIHYPSLTRGIPNWAKAFGDASAHEPVLVTEWDANSTRDCVSGAPADVPLLLDYLAGKGIGLVGFAFDLPGTIVANYSYAPTSYRHFRCGVPGGGPGSQLFGDDAGEAAAESGTTAAAPVAWILSSDALSRLRASDRGLAAESFDTPLTFVTGATGPRLRSLSVPHAVATASFTSESTLDAAITDDTLPRGTRAVLLTLGNSPQTPRAERTRPEATYAQAERVAHAHHLLLVAAPMLSLATAQDPSARTVAEQETVFLDRRIAAGAARYADILVVQAAASERDLSRFAHVLRTAAAQASEVDPGIELLGALSTFPQHGRAAPAPVLQRAATTLGAPVTGFLLDDPTPSGCSACASSGPTRTLIALLRAVRASAR